MTRMLLFLEQTMNIFEFTNKVRTAAAGLGNVHAGRAPAVHTMARRLPVQNAEAAEVAKGSQDILDRPRLMSRTLPVMTRGPAYPL